MGHIQGTLQCSVPFWPEVSVVVLEIVRMVPHVADHRLYHGTGAIELPIFYFSPFQETE